MCIFCLPLFSITSLFVLLVWTHGCLPLSVYNALNELTSWLYIGFRKYSDSWNTQAVQTLAQGTPGWAQVHRIRFHYLEMPLELAWSPPVFNSVDWTWFWKCGFRATKTSHWASHWSFHLPGRVANVILICPPLHGDLSDLLEWVVLFSHRGRMYAWACHQFSHTKFPRKHKTAGVHFLSLFELFFDVSLVCQGLRCACVEACVCVCVLPKYRESNSILPAYGLLVWLLVPLVLLLPHFIFSRFLTLAHPQQDLKHQNGSVSSISLKLLFNGCSRVHECVSLTLASSLAFFSWWELFDEYVSEIAF